MKTSRYLRTAAFVALVQFVAHALMFVFSRPRHGPDEVAVVEAMKAHFFDFGGFSRSYWEMYFGYGLLAAVNCFFEGMILWQLAKIARVQASLVRSIVWLFSIANGVHVLLCLRFFFLVPVAPDIAIMVLLGLALAASIRGPSSPEGVLINVHGDISSAEPVRSQSEIVPTYGKPDYGRFQFFKGHRGRDGLSTDLARRHGARFIRRRISAVNLLQASRRANLEESKPIVMIRYTA